MEQATPLVSQVPDRFLGFNRGTVGIVEGANHQTVVLFNVPLSINQQWEPWSFGHLGEIDGIAYLNNYAIFIDDVYVSGVSNIKELYVESLHLNQESVAFNNIDLSENVYHKLLLQMNYYV